MPSRRAFLAGTAALLAGGAAPPGVAGAQPARADLAPLRIGQVTLVVHDIERVGRFYRDVLGLAVVDQNKDALFLGAGGRSILELWRNPRGVVQGPSGAGLYHTAFLLPSRRHMAQWLVHAAGKGVELQGASDHLVSEAVYLADPEGNGVEVYCDRPRSGWRWVDGQVEMATRPLDLVRLAAAEDYRGWAGMPEGASVGHIHLRVGDIAQAEAFYAGVLGFDVTRRRDGATFLASGGYHHHIAVNTWESAGAGPRPTPAAGLAIFEVMARDEATHAALIARVRKAGLVIADTDTGLRIEDPWGTCVLMRLG